MNTLADTLKLELKNVKIWAGPDGPVFQASLYIDGKKSGVVSNQGFGGPNEYHEIKKEDLERLDAYCASIPPKETDIKNKDGSPWMYQMDSEGLVDHLLQEWEDKKELKKCLKRGTVVHKIIDGKDAIIEYKIKWEDRTKQFKWKGESERKSLEQKLCFVSSGTPARGISHKDTVLNLLPFEEALELFVKGIQK